MNINIFPRDSIVCSTAEITYLGCVSVCYGCSYTLYGVG